MELPKSLKIKKYIKIFLYVTILLILGGYLFVLGYSFIYEKDNIAIDRYNFEQLEKVKIILDNANRSKIAFNDLREYNRAYNTNIQPIKNCYYISSNNGNQPYIFGFQFESLLYKFFYFRKYYAYPKYDIPYNELYYGLSIPGKKMGRGHSYSDGFDSFILITSNPCSNQNF